MHTIPFTKNGFNDLNKQLQEITAKRPEAVSSLQRGREMGDLSENGLYKAAKMELSNIDREIRFLKNLIKYGRPSVPTGNIVIQIGTTVVIENELGQKEYQIVGEYEANPREYKISYKSPIGHSLMGKKVGNEIIINTPRGDIRYLIQKISC